MEGLMRRARTQGSLSTALAWLPRTAPSWFGNNAASSSKDFLTLWDGAGGTPGLPLHSVLAYIIIHYISLQLFIHLLASLQTIHSV